jgi:hypothetical protein
MVTPYVVAGKSRHDIEQDAMIAIAEREVASRGLCQSALVPPEERRLWGSSHERYLSIYVECTK